MRQGDDPVGAQDLRVNRRLVLEHVEPGARDKPRLDEARKLVLVDHLAACRVDDIGRGLQETQPPRRQQVIGAGRVRAVDRDDVDARQHLIEAFPIGRLELLLDVLRDAAPVVIVDLQAERLGAASDRLADASHADDAEPLAEDAVTEHPRGRPSSPVLGGSLKVVGTLHEAARHGQDQRHGHVGGVLGQHAGRVRHGDAAVARGIEIDVVDAGAEVGDEAQLRTGLGDDGAIDAVRHRRHQHVGDLEGFHHLRLCHRRIVDVEARIEQLPHAGFDHVWQLARDDDDRLLGAGRHGGFRCCLVLAGGRTLWGETCLVPILWQCLTDGHWDDKVADRHCIAAEANCGLAACLNDKRP